MTPDDYKAIQSEFLILRELGGGERESRLAELADHPAEFLQSLLRLLDADQADDEFLNQPLVQRVQDPALQSTSIIPASNSAENYPEAVGPYRILQKIGEGGHGLIFMAEQIAPIRRKVAIKWIKPGMDSNMVLARFEAERQALAMMSHPSIANVIDAGQTRSGQPYFVMELVHGIPIDEFCHSNDLNLNERLQLFCQVCDAVHHAHRKGIIHRDIKPSNVLITIESGAPLAKVIDFGIAKALHMPLTDKTMYTEFGQIIGTLEYMSPEQAMMSQSGIDVRSDVYSLGVLLYLLLTGGTPLSKQELLKKGIWELRTVLQEAQPQTPSLRITTGEVAQRWRDVADSPMRWARSVRGELDWITMKALAKEPAKRYDSAAEFSQDIECYLTGELVNARPPSRIYTIQKWIQRHRFAAMVSTVIVASVFVSVLSLWWAFAKSQENLSAVTEARQEVRAKAEQLQSALATSQQEKKRADGMLQRQLIQTAWTSAFDGDRDTTAVVLEDILPKKMSFENRFVSAVAEQMRLAVLRPASAGTIRNMAVHRSHGQVAVINSKSQLELYSTLDGQQATVEQLPVRIYSTLQYSTDGRTLLIASADSVTLYDVMTNVLQPSVVVGRGSIRRIAHDNVNKKWVLTTGSNRIVWLDDNSLQERSRTILPTRILDLAVSTDGTAIAVAALDGRLFVLFSDIPQQFTTIAREQPQITDLVFHNDVLQVADLSGNVQTFKLQLPMPTDAESSEQSGVILNAKTTESAFQTSAAPTEIDLNNDGSAIVAIDGKVSRYTSDGIEFPIREFSTKVRDVTTVNGTEQLLITQPSGQMLLLPNTEAIRRVREFQSLAGIADGISIPGTELTVTAHDDGTIRKWKRQQGELLATRQLHRQSVFEIDLAPQHQLIASMGGDRQVVISDTTSLDVVHSLDVGWGVRCVAFSHSGSLLVAGPDRNNAMNLVEGTIDLWDVQSGQPLKRLAGHTNWVMNAEFSLDDSVLATLSVDETIRIWSTASGEVTCELSLTGLPRATAMKLRSDGRFVAVGHEDGSLTTWDTVSGELLQQALLSDDAVLAIGFVSQEDLLVVSRSAGGLTFANPISLETSATFTIGTDRITAARFNRTTTSLQLVTQQGRSYLWNW